MKKYRRSRDDGRFALTTLQNPNLEVRSLPQLIAAAQNLIAEQEACPPEPHGKRTGPPLKPRHRPSPSRPRKTKPFPQTTHPPKLRQSSQNHSQLTPLCRKPPRPPPNHPPSPPPHQPPTPPAPQNSRPPIPALITQESRARPAPSPRPPPRTHRSRTPRAQMRYLRESLSRHD